MFIFTLVKTPERLRKFEWIDQYYVATDSFYALSSRTDIVIESLEDAQKYVTCIPRNDVGEQRLKKLGFADSQLKIVAVQSQCIGMLNRGRVDLVLFNELGVRSLLSSLNIARPKVKRMFVVSKAVMGLAASRNSDQQIVQNMRQNLKQLKQDPWFGQQLTRWFGSEHLQ